MNLALLVFLGLSLERAAGAQAAKSDISVDSTMLVDLKTIRLDLKGDLKRSELLTPAEVLLLESDGKQVSVDVMPSNGSSAFHPTDPDYFDRFLIVLTTGKDFSLSETYSLIILSLEDASSRVKPGLVPVDKLGGMLTVTPLRPDRINVVFFGPDVRMSTDTKDISVQVKRKDSVRELVLARPPETVGTQNLVLYINPLTPLQHGDVLMVTTMLEGGKGQVVSTKEIKFPKPKDKASSLVFLSMAGESGKGQDPVVSLDLKVANPYLIPLGKEKGSLETRLSSWTFGPVVEAEISSTDKNNTNRFSNALNFERLVVNLPKQRGYAIDLAPKIEFETGFSNRNAIASAQGELIFLGADWRCPGSNNKDCWIVFRPALGAEAGTNFGLEGDHEGLEDYSITRAVGGFYFSWTRKSQRVDLNSISFSVDGRARYLFNEEADFEPNPGGKKNPDGSTASLVGGDGWKPYGKAALSFAISENYAISLEYSRGERPPLFKDEDKVKLTFAFAF